MAVSCVLLVILLFGRIVIEVSVFLRVQKRLGEEVCLIFLLAIENNFTPLRKMPLCPVGIHCGENLEVLV